MNRRESLLLTENNFCDYIQFSPSLDGLVWHELNSESKDQPEPVLAVSAAQPMFPWKFFTHFDGAELSFKFVTNLEGSFFPRAENFLTRISHRAVDGIGNSPSGNAVKYTILISEDTLTSSFPNCSLCCQVKQCVCLISSPTLPLLSRISWATFIDIYFFGAQAVQKAYMCM